MIICSFCTNTYKRCETFWLVLFFIWLALLVKSLWVNQWSYSGLALQLRIDSWCNTPVFNHQWLHTRFPCKCSALFAETRHSVMAFYIWKKKAWKIWCPWVNVTTVGCYYAEWWKDKVDGWFQILNHFRMSGKAFLSCNVIIMLSVDQVYWQTVGLNDTDVTPGGFVHWTLVI